MTKTLYILRHAKSSWSNSQLADFDRPLNERGRRATEALTTYIKETNVAPAVVLCSTARRTQDTLEGIRAALPDDVEVRLEDDLYGAEPSEIIDFVRTLPDSVPSAMVVGHNPAMHELAVGLTEAANRLGRFPTGALATLTFDKSWDGLRPGTATLADLALPRELD